MKWAIKIPFEKSWLYVVDGSIDKLTPLLYNSKEEAEKAAVIWKMYKVVEYEENLL
jgi:hypothetical protein